MPSCSVTVWRASARHRRASGARRSRNVAFSRSIYAVLIIAPPCERHRSVSTRAGAPSTIRRSGATTPPPPYPLTTWAQQIWRHGCKWADAMALLLAHWVSPGLSGLLGLTDIRIEGRFGDTHQFTDVLHRDLFLLIELHRPLPFLRGQRLRPPAQASTGPGHTQPR